MMKSHSAFLLAAASIFLWFPGRAAVPENVSARFVYESTNEFFGSGDFDGDGKLDLVIVDKESGKYRLGYQTTSGVYNWVDCRYSGLKSVTGFTIGRLFTTNADGFAFAAPEGPQISLVEATSSAAPGKPLLVPFNDALGPNTIVAVDIGSFAKTGLLDLYVASIYNSPDPNLGTFLQNTGTTFPKIGEVTLAGAAGHANRLSLKANQPDVLCTLLTGEKGDTFAAENLSSGKVVPLASVPGLPSGSEYAADFWGGSSLRKFVFYQAGSNNLFVRPVEEAGAGSNFGKGSDFKLDQPIKRVIAIAHAESPQLLVIFGEGHTAGVFDFDGAKAPVLKHTIYGTNDLITCAQSVPDGFMVFLQAPDGKFSTKYQVYNTSGGGCVPGTFGTLPSLADNDNITIPDIHARIVSNTAVKNATDMKAYTNTIPGTQVRYAMVPIPGGEFVMGSPESEAGRKPDESPQHKVKLAPFWMGRCEVTWNEYELFMYSDEEKQMRASNPTDATGDKLADAVTHPSKPYVEMSFGMGKDGYPAISMTHHAANKYCQWLSAKTGQFYRLPTEAEWEYACRAGTTTAYFFGDDPSKLAEYGWYEQNADFKYQKVGKKKPNPWGLYDMYGNVTEWVLDQYDPGFYKQSSAVNPSVEPWNRATKPYPHSVRGGSYDDEAVMCRSAARRGSDRSWKMTDPQLPKSVWYLSDAPWVGFRIVRPLEVPSADKMQRYWTSGTERD
jgi:formylglycine-generating enzyme required for sulfatase activity